MKKIKIVSVILVMLLIFTLAGNVNATENYTVSYGEIKNGKVDVTVNFTSDLPTDFSQDGWTKKDSKTITKTMNQGSYEVFSIDGETEWVDVAVPFELEEGSSLTCMSGLTNYKSSNPNVLKIEDGKIVAVSAGTAQITAQTNGVYIGGHVSNLEFTGTVKAKDDGTITWTDGSKIELKAESNRIDRMNIKTNLEQKENSRYYIYISKKQNENITTETEGCILLSKDSEGKLSASINKNYLELSGPNYAYIIEKVTSTGDNYGKEKVILSGKELENPELPTLGNRLDIWLYMVNKTSVSNKIGMSEDRNIQYKIGKITSNDILKSFKNESSDVAFAKLLEYAKGEKALKEGTITTNGLDSNLVADINIEKDAYYFVYMIADTQNGKYNELEDIAIYRECNLKEGNALVHFSFADIELSDDNTNVVDNTTSDEKIPQTGANATMTIVLATMVVIGIVRIFRI